MIHGLPKTYTHQGCRCASCVAAQTRSVKRWRVITRDGSQPITVPVVGTLRRLQALGCNGWTLVDIARESSTSVDTLKRIVYGEIERCWPSTASAVALAYERLCMTQAPAGRYATRRKTLARRNGWAPPLAWDDIDNDAEPADLSHLKRMVA